MGTNRCVCPFFVPGEIVLRLYLPFPGISDGFSERMALQWKQESKTYHMMHKITAMVRKQMRGYTLWIPAPGLRRGRRRRYDELERGEYTPSGSVEMRCTHRVPGLVPGLAR